MRPLYLLAASALALTATACAPGAPTARAALDCPVRQGALSRTSASPDGKVCTYAGAHGTEVTLQLVSTQGGVDQALSAIETTLLAQRVAPAESGKDGEKGEPAKAGSDAVKDADKAIKEAAEDARQSGPPAKVDGKSGDGVHVEMKDGKTVVTKSDDGDVRINLPGIHVVANDNDDSAQVSVGPIHIDAGGGRNTVRIRRDVRLRGEALNPNRRGIRATFIYTGIDLPDGYHFVGYEAGGPKGGPITVAVVKSKAGDADDNDLYPDVKKLVRKNGGV